MPSLLDQARQVYRGPVAVGSSTPNNPDKGQIVALWAQLEAALNILMTSIVSANTVAYPTLAQLQADTGRPEGSLGFVTNDGNNSGIYQWNGSEWVLTPLVLPASFGDTLNDAIVAMEETREQTDAAAAAAAASAAAAHSAVVDALALYGGAEALAIAVADAGVAAGQAEQAYQDIIDFAANGPEAASVANKVNLNGDNLNETTRLALRVNLGFDLDPEESALIADLQADQSFRDPYWTLDRQTQRPFNAMQGFYVDLIRGYAYDMSQGSFGGIDKTIVSRYGVGPAGTLSTTVSMTETDLIGHQGVNVEPDTGKLVICGPDQDASDVVRCDFNPGGLPLNREVYKLFPVGQNGGHATPGLSPDGKWLAVRAAIDSTTQKIRVFDWLALRELGPGNYADRTDLFTEFVIPYGTPIGYHSQSLMCTRNLVWEYGGFGDYYEVKVVRAWTREGRLVFENNNCLVGAIDCSRNPTTWEPEAITCTYDANGKMQTFMGCTFGGGGARVSKVYAFGGPEWSASATPTNRRAMSFSMGYRVRGHFEALTNPYSGFAGDQNHGISAGAASYQISYWGTSGSSEPSIVFTKSESGAVGVHGAIAAGSNLGALDFQGSNGTDFSRAASIFVESPDGLVGANATGEVQVFTNDGTSLTRALRITKNGKTRATSGLLTSPLESERADTGDHLTMIRNGTTYGSLWLSTSFFQVVARSGCALALSTSADAASTPTGRWVVEAAGTFRPASDNALDIGTGSLRVKTYYGATGTINTSDGREKAGRDGAPLTEPWTVSPLTPAEIAAARDLAKEIGVFKFLDAVTEKGDAARLHCGMTVQRAVAIMQGHGLDPFAYSFICRDEWGDAWEDVTETVQVDSLRVLKGVNDAGEEIWVDEPVYEDRPVMEDDGSPKRNLIQAAGERYSFRPDGLHAFLIRGFEARLSVLEAA